MKLLSLSADEIRAACSRVAGLYPNLPSLILWRGFECASFTHFSLEEPVLDIGCGDGAFFRFLWPRIHDVSGVEADPATAEAAVKSGVYRDVQTVAADAMRFDGRPFASAFANCSLEHMDRLGEVLGRTHAALRPGGGLLLSVVTEKFLEWSPLPLLIGALGEPRKAELVAEEYVCYHHLVNPLPVTGWVAALEQSGFEVTHHVPLMPELSSRAFLLFDQLWHVKAGERELGAGLFEYFRAFPRLSGALADLISKVYAVEERRECGSGAVFYAVKP